METLNEWLSPHFIWLLIGLILLALEFVIPGLITLFFGLGAWLVAIICLVFDISLTFQLTLFLIFSLALLIFLRRWFQNFFSHGYSASEIETREMVEFIGQKAIVTKKITPEAKGKVEFHGSYWDAEAYETIPKGSTVEIIDKKNITLIVNRL